MAAGEKKIKIQGKKGERKTEENYIKNGEKGLKKVIISLLTISK